MRSKMHCVGLLLLALCSTGADCFPDPIGTAIIQNDTEDSINLSYFADYEHTRIDDATLSPGETFTMTMPGSWEQTITAIAASGESLEYSFTYPFCYEVCHGDFEIHFCEREGQLRLGTQGGDPHSADRLSAQTVVTGEAVSLPAVELVWTADSNNLITTDLWTDDAIVTSFEAPAVDETTALLFHAAGCTKPDSFETTIVVKPTPAFIMETVQTRLLVDGQVALEADLKGREPENYLFSWLVEPQRMGSFDDPEADAAILTVHDVGQVTVTLVVTEVESGLHAEDTIALQVNYDGPGILVDAGPDITRELGNTIVYGADAYGEISEAGLLTFSWSQDEANPSPLDVRGSHCSGEEFHVDLPASSSETLPCEYLDVHPTEIGVYRFDVTVRDETGEVQDSDYVVLTIEPRSG